MIPFHSVPRGTSSKVPLRNVLLTSIVFLLMLSQAIPAMAQGEAWTQIYAAAEGEFINALAVDPQTPGTLYIGTDKGVFKSTDGGATWRAVHNGLADTLVLALAVDPQQPSTLYAGTRKEGVFKSTDGGEVWNAVNNGLTDPWVLALAIDPQTPSVVYAGTQGSGVFKSTDGGAMWYAANVGLTNMRINALAIDPQIPGTLYAGTDGGVFVSVDGGTTWHASNNGLENPIVLSLAIDPQTPATLYAGTGGGGIFKSTDGGSTWYAVNNGLTNRVVSALAVDPQIPGTLYAATQGGGVFRSTDGGSTWQAVNAGLTHTNVAVLALDPHTPGKLYAGTWLGGWVSEIQFVVEVPGPGTPPIAAQPSPVPDIAEISHVACSPTDTYFVLSFNGQGKTNYYYYQVVVEALGDAKIAYVAPVVAGNLMKKILEHVLVEIGEAALNLSGIGTVLGIVEAFAEEWDRQQRTDVRFFSISWNNTAAQPGLQFVVWGTRSASGGIVVTTRWARYENESISQGRTVPVCP